MKIFEKINRIRFNFAVHAILKTPPLQIGNEDFIVLSMVQHRDVLPYLLALKSFARYLSPQRVVVVADPSLNDSDRTVMRTHVPHIEFREAAEFHQSGIPKGGTWERLTAISEYAQKQYVVQLDADTVSTLDLPEVRQAIRAKSSFALGTEDFQPIEDGASVAALAKSKLTNNDHIQLLAESNLDQLDAIAAFKYARACSGFSGFAPGAINIGVLRSVSELMGQLLNGKWENWGTEQFTSNLIVCSAPGGHLLPHPRYCNPWRMTGDSVFLHMIGYTRYQSGLYARLAKQVTQELSRHGR